MRLAIMIRLVMLLAVGVFLTTFTTAYGQSSTQTDCEKREKQLLDSLLKFEAMKPAFKNALEIIDVYDGQLQIVREESAKQLAILDEQHRKELKRQERRERWRGRKQGIATVTGLGLILLLLL